MTLSTRVPEEREWIAHAAFARQRYARTEDGLLLLTRAVELFPQEAYLHYQLAAYENRFVRPHYARKHLTEAIKLDPSFATAALNNPHYFSSLEAEIRKLVPGDL